VLLHTCYCNAACYVVHSLHDSAQETLCSRATPHALAMPHAMSCILHDGIHDMWQSSVWGANTSDTWACLADIPSIAKSMTLQHNIVITVRKSFFGIPQSLPLSLCPSHPPSLSVWLCVHGLVPMPQDVHSGERGQLSRTPVCVDTPAWAFLPWKLHRVERVTR
jgi:hypothetical protein